jgi:hypothetical protein
VCLPFAHKVLTEIGSGAFTWAVAEFLNYSPRPGAVFFVIARPLIHDVMPLLMPSRRSFIVQLVVELVNIAVAKRRYSSQRNEFVVIGFFNLFGPKGHLMGFRSEIG